MSLPTAHSYVFESLMENLSSIEKNFLTPSLLLKHLTITEKLLSEVVEVLNKKDYSEETALAQKEDLAQIVQKLAHLEKASQNKLTWVSQFSEYLRSNINTK